MATHSSILAWRIPFSVIHTVKGFGIVNKAERDVFLELSCFFHDPADVGKYSLVPLPFLKPQSQVSHIADSLLTKPPGKPPEPVRSDPIGC